MEKKEEQKKYQEDNKDCPPGCIKMSESERLDTLQALNEQKRDVTNQLEKMPISLRTQALQNKKTALEDKLAELDRSISMFSKKVVYVAI